MCICVVFSRYLPGKVHGYGYDQRYNGYGGYGAGYVVGFGGAGYGGAGYGYDAGYVGAGHVANYAGYYRGHYYSMYNNKSQSCVI